MLHNTRGIVLHQIKYSESSVIVKIYTEQFGNQSYIVRGIRSKKSKIKPALLQHLTIVDLVVYHKEKKNLQNIKEIKVSYPFKSIPYNINKSSIAVFLNEFLYHVIKEEESNQELFNFLVNTIQLLDLEEGKINDFHLLFLIQLTKYLGFYPKNNYTDVHTNFDMEEGIFTNKPAVENLIIGKPFSFFIYQLSNVNFENLNDVNWSGAQRNHLVEIILNYYRLHLPVNLNIKSHLVLQSVLHG